MSGIFQNLLQDAAGAFFGSDYLRDYTHASKAFRTNNYAYSPKFKFLFHVYFNINTAAAPSLAIAGQDNFGILVKSVKLPSFSFDTTTMNQYNRKRIVQTKLKYDPIDITFHDDNADRIRTMWYTYYTYYYKDATHLQAQNSSGSIITSPAYNERTQYQPSIAGNEDWGYSGEPNASVGGNKKVPFFKDITIYGLNRHNFSAYTLINPIITHFGHDTYNYAEGNGTMENKMTIDYETVKYYSGAIAGAGRSPDNIIPGFGNSANYDTRPSPISMPGSQNNILGQGGLIDGALGVMSDLQNGTFSLNTLKTLGTTIKTASSMNLKQAITGELTSLATTQLVAAAASVPMNRNLLASFPSFPGVAGGPNGAQKAPPPIGP